ncbi:BDH protein, partial [Polyodon spathula]|nr:BDH protein [Polyodon spathula]
MKNSHNSQHSLHLCISGRMVFVSSILAFVYVPNLGVYSVTKRAVEAFADCLRVELATFGVCIIEPGNFGSVTKVLREKAAEEIWNQFSDEHKKMFNQEYLHIVTDYVNTQFRAGNKNIHLVIDAMVDVLVSPTPNTRYLVDNRMNKIFFFMFPYLLTCVADSFFACSGIYRKRKTMLFFDQVQ